MKALATGLLVAALASGCALFGGDPPDRTCRSDNDCFRAQGERCNPSTRTCEVMPDAAVADAPAIDAPTIDAPDIDAVVAPPTPPAPAGEPPPAEVAP